MRNLLLYLAAAATTVLTASSCSKSSPTVVDNGRIERITIPLSDPGISQTRIRTADSLLDANHIRHNNLRYYQFYETGSGADHDVTITADQYANGLRIFNLQKVFAFRNGVLVYGDTTMTHGTTPDTVASMPLSRLRSLYSTLLHRTRNLYHVNYTDSAYLAEFGYVNTTPFGPQQTFVKGWRVSIKRAGLPNNTAYAFPDGYFDDHTGDGLPSISTTVVVE